MKTSPDILPHLIYPVLKWQPASILLARTAARLCAKNESGYSEDLQDARQGRSHLFDCGGHHFKIVDYIKVEPFGSFSQVFWASTFKQSMYVPVLSQKRQLSLNEFKIKVASAVNDRFLDDIAEEKAAKASLEAIRIADSFPAALEAVPHFCKS